MARQVGVVGESAEAVNLAVLKGGRWSRTAVAFLLFLLGASASHGAGTATLDREVVPVAGRQEAIVTVSAFGRYALSVESDQGVALQLIDRMVGPGEIAGQTGLEDGRLDLFLDQGEYKLVTYGPAASAGGQGEARLAVRPFIEAPGEAPVQLVEHKPVAAALGDLESRSYWLPVEQRRWVILEAAGRYLRDLRLWRDGSWLVDAEPQCAVVDPVEGQPLLDCRLAVELNPGLYRLAAYGGVGQPWAEASRDNPFHLRFGIPPLPEAGRARRTVSPFGVDRFRVPASANFFRVELPEARPATLVVADLVKDAPLRRGGSRAEVRKNSVPPVAEVILPYRSQGGKGQRVITVEAPAGQPYTLQHFQRRDTYPFAHSGAYWLSTVHSGPVGDSLDVTALVVEHPRGGPPPRIEPTLSQVVEVGSGQGWARRANLLDTLTVFVRLTETGKYEILSQGTDAEFRLEPFLLEKPRNYRQPPFQVGGGEWALDAGYYVLTIQPRQKGILDVVLRPKGLLNVLMDRVGSGTSGEPARPAVIFGEVALKKSSTYTLYLNTLPEVSSGIVLRSLPLDLDRPLPLALLPGQEVTVPVRAREVGWLAATTEGGERLELAGADGPGGGLWLPRLRLGQGRYAVRVRNRGAEPVVASLAFEPTRWSQETPLPPLPAERLAALPDFPVLTAAAPHALDLDRDQRATFRVTATEPALYRLETTGLLATSGNLRSRVVTSLESGYSNGVGRNFLIQMYLRQGDYQLTVNPEGESAGHLGVRLVKAPLTEAGTLTAGTVARATLAPEGSLVYRFQLPEAGRYRLRALGEEGLFPVRLEDGDGWPLVPPGVAGDLVRDLAAGDYRLVILPASVPRRVVTLLTAVPEPVQRTGHGPHALPLAEPVEHLWREPEGATTERSPDRWRFTLPAAVAVEVQLGAGMEGEVHALPEEPSEAASEGETVATLPAGKGWSGELPAGRYEIVARAARRNNLLPYSVLVTPGALLPGEEREVTTPGELAVATAGGLVEIRSFGQVDARGRLYDEDGRLVASQDDAPDDWNFRLVTRLTPGRYRLVVDAIADEGSFTSVRMEALEERLGAAVEAPTTGVVALRQAVAEAVLLLPLELPSGADFLLARAAGTGLGLSLEAREGAAWRTVVSAEGRGEDGPQLAVALPGKGARRREASYRLRLWSLDRRPTTAQLAVAAPQAAARREGEMAAGVPWRPVDATLGFHGVLTVALERPGVLRVDAGAAPGAILACVEGVGLAAPCTPIQGPVAASGDRLRLVARTSSGTADRVKAQRLILGPAGLPPLSPPLAGVEDREPRPLVVDLERGAAGGALVVLATSAVGQPAVGIAASGRWTPGQLDPPRTLGAAPGAAVAVSLAPPTTPVAVLWDGTLRSEGDPLDARLRRLAYRAVPVEPGGWGRFEGALAGVAARVFSLPPGPKRLRFALGESLVAVLSSGDRVTSVHWLGGQAFAEAVRTAADRLTLLHTGDGAHRFVVDALPTTPGAGDAAAVTATGPVLVPDRPFEARFLERGWERLTVPPGTVATGDLRTLGRRPGEALPLWVGADGRVAVGETLPATLFGPTGEVGGTLRLPHDDGLVLAWFEPPPGPGDTPWLAGLEAAPVAVEPPAVVPLSGTVQRLTFDLRQPSLVSLRAGGGAVAVVRGPSSSAPSGTPSSTVSIHPDGVAVDAYLPAGHGEIWLRGLAGWPLAGSAEITAAPVQEIGEGLGPEVLLAAGETRLFAFPVHRAGPVGLGVRADADVVEVRLLNTAGETLGEGFVQMPELEPGTYLLALTAPTDTRPLRARPAVVGIDPPGTGPPREVIEAFLAKAGEFEGGAE